MADTGNASDMRHLSTSARGPVKGSPNLSGGWVVMLLSGLIAAVLFFFATQQTSSRVDVATVSRDVAAGQPIDANAFGRAQIATSDAQLGKLIPYEDRGQYAGFIAAGPLTNGDLVAKSSLREPAAPQQRRSMSVPVDKSHANNGNIRAGDRVDIIEPEADDPYVVRNIEVLSVQESGGSGGIGAISQFIIVVSVDENQAIAVSQAVNSGKFDVIRSTGATTSALPTSTAPTSTTTTTARP